MDGWTLYNKGQQTQCRSCLKKASCKPNINCTEHRHLLCYEKNRIGTNNRRKQAQLEALIKYSGFCPPKCVLCEYDNILALQIDHINGNGAEFRRKYPHLTGKAMAMWLKMNNWPNGYRILCANCQILERERLG